MKKNMKFVGILLAAVLASSMIAGCGGAKEKAEEAASEAASVVEEAAEEAASAAEEAVSEVEEAAEEAASAAEEAVEEAASEVEEAAEEAASAAEEAVSEVEEAAEAVGSEVEEAAEEAASAAEEAVEEAEAPAEGGEGVFKIGASGPMTGGAAQYGLAVVNAAELAVKEINENGGMNGYQVEYQKQDDEHDAEKSVNAYNALKDWGMQILVGPTTSAPCVAVAEKTFADNMFQITPSGSAVECVAHENVFRVCFSDPDQGIASADYMAEHELGTKIGVIYDSSDVYSSGIEAKFVEEAAAKGLDVYEPQAFTADSKTDFSAQLQNISNAGCDVVFLPFYYTEASIVLTQADKMGYDPVFFGCDGMDGILSMENFDVSLAEGVMLLTPFVADATDDLTVNFVKNYQEAYGETPNQFAADSYDAVYAIKAAIEDQGVTPDMSVSDICEALKTGITNITFAGLTSDETTWAASGEPTKAPKAVVIKDGAYVSAE